MKEEENYVIVRYDGFASMTKEIKPITKMKFFLVRNSGEKLEVAHVKQAMEVCSKAADWPDTVWVYETCKKTGAPVHSARLRKSRDGKYRRG